MLFILLVLSIILKFARKEGYSEAYIFRVFQERPLKTVIWSMIRKLQKATEDINLIHDR
jgi:hypothetical protein